MRKKVLVVLRPEWVEVYADDGVDVRIVTAPDMETQEGEVLAEEYLGGVLPRRYKDIYYPGNLRDSSVVRSIKPSDIAQRNWELEMLKSLGKCNAEEI